MITAVEYVSCTYDNIKLQLDELNEDRRLKDAIGLIFPFSLCRSSLQIGSQIGS